MHGETLKYVKSINVNDSGHSSSLVRMYVITEILLWIWGMWFFVSAMVKERSDGTDHARTSCYCYTFTSHPHARDARWQF